jgi:hypothetical protein
MPPRPCTAVWEAPENSRVARNRLLQFRTHPLQRRFCSSFHLWQIAGRTLPDPGWIHLVISVAQHVPERPDCVPRRPWRKFVSLCAQFSRCLAQTFEAALNCVAGAAVGVKRRAIQADRTAGSSTKSLSQWRSAASLSRRSSSRPKWSNPPDENPALGRMAKSTSDVSVPSSRADEPNRMIVSTPCALSSAPCQVEQPAPEARTHRADGANN